MSETIFGLDTSRDDAARIMSRFIRQDWLAVEGPLFRGKWFDYRFMNPVQATYLYAHEFVKAYRRNFSINIDSRRGPHVTPVNVEVLFDISGDLSPKEITKRKQRASGIWRGRMVADAMGMPYDIYLDRAFHWTLRYWQQRTLPRPQQLYSDMVVDRAGIDWEQRQKDEFFYSTLPQYKNGFYYEAISRLSGDATLLHSQNAHHDWLLDQSKDRPNGHAFLAQMIFHDQVLPLEKAKSFLDDNGFERVMSLAQSEPVVIRYN